MCGLGLGAIGSYVFFSLLTYHRSFVFYLPSTLLFLSHPLFFFFFDLPFLHSLSSFYFYFYYIYIFKLTISVSHCILVFFHFISLSFFFSHPFHVCFEQTKHMPPWCELSVTTSYGVDILRVVARQGAYSSSLVKGC